MTGIATGITFLVIFNAIIKEFFFVVLRRSHGHRRPPQTPQPTHKLVARARLSLHHAHAGVSTLDDAVHGQLGGPLAHLLSLLSALDVMEPHQPAAAFARRLGVGVWVFESLFVRWYGCEVVEEGLSRRLHRGQRAFLAAPILVVLGQAPPVPLSLS